MRIAIFTVLTALLGFASCDLVCMQFKISECFAKIAIRNILNPICASNKELTDCYRAGAQECGVESAPIIAEILTQHSEPCVHGTEMNELYEKHRVCMFNDAVLGNAMCMRPLLSKVLNFGMPSRTREYQEKFMKVACKYSEKGDKCVYDNINSTCGGEAAEFRHRLSDAAIRLSRMACEEVDADTNEISYSNQQNHDQSVDTMSPHLHHLSAVGPQVGGIQIASTVAPRIFPEPVAAGSTINLSHLIYVMLATILTKWFSSY